MTKIIQNTHLSLSARILLLNLLALILLLVGILYLNQFRQSLIESKVDALETQSEIISATISASATSSKGTNLFVFDRNIANGNGFDQRVIKYRNYRINKKLLESIIGQLIDPKTLNAKIYDSNNKLIHESNQYFSEQKVAIFPISEIEDESLFRSIYNKIIRFFGLDSIRHLKYANDYNVVANALDGSKNIVVNKNQSGQAIVHVSVPIVKFKAIVGYLVLSTQSSTIDMIVYEERAAIMKVFMIASLITIILSLILSNTIAKPMRELADAADELTNNLNIRKKIPDFTKRNDEIGNLSGALNNMTVTLLNRIDTIEKFSADVAHELRNPLTSLRSAIEAFPVIKNKNERLKLIGIIQEDIDRVDRLISDISETSKLDTALTVEEREITDIYEFLHDLIMLQNSRYKTNPIKLNHDEIGIKLYSVINRDRLNQVFINLFDNARSFSKDGDSIDVNLYDERGVIYIEVSDFGGGIMGTKIDRIFDRFYTDRPNKVDTKKHSGLGLSIVKQIVDSHDGEVSVKNFKSGQHKGTRFKIKLPKHI
ncbi:MAG: histidine kinase [Hyphomicrobiales bacterium]|nr:MAG: histidine kinase [Hyphomicrobiales bacterium]